MVKIQTYLLSKRLLTLDFAKNYRQTSILTVTTQ